MDSKRRRLLEEDAEKATACGENELLVRHYVCPFSQTQLADILADICTRIPEAFEMLEAMCKDSLDHRKLFVRGLAWSSTSDELKAVLSKHGEITEAAVVTDKVTGLSVPPFVSIVAHILKLCAFLLGMGKGFAFVTFQDAAAAASAVAEGTYKLDGRTIYATVAALRAGSNATASTVPTGGATASPSRAIPAMSPVYTAPMQPQNNTYGHAISHSAAPAGGVESLDSRFDLCADCPYDFSALNCCYVHRKVFLRGLPFSVTQETMQSIFSPFGAIEKIEMLPDKDTGKFR